MSIPSFLLGGLTGMLTLHTITDKQTKQQFANLVRAAYADIQKGIDKQVQQTNIDEQTEKEHANAQNT